MKTSYNLSPQERIQRLEETGLATSKEECGHCKVPVWCIKSFIVTVGAAYKNARRERRHLIISYKKDRAPGGDRLPTETDLRVALSRTGSKRPMIRDKSGI